MGMVIWQGPKAEIIDCGPENEHIFLFYCPGCKSPHTIPYGRSSKPVWKFDEDYDCPTFDPSLRMYYTKENEAGAKVEVTTCHLHVKKGVIEYCGDCQHELSGQKVPLPDLPDQWRHRD